MNLSKINFFNFFLLIFCFNNVKCDTDNCSFRTCGECISNANCVWCAEDEFNEHRCQLNSSALTKKDWCKSIINPQPHNETIQDLDFSEKGKIVQLKPQRIKIKARPEVPVKFNVTYKPALHFPLDVYYLMDISFTMKLKMHYLLSQTKIIYEDLLTYTNNVRLGVGSFVDKPGFPFYDSQQNYISHAFKNHVSLTSNMSVFNESMKNIEFGANYDDPEAGLDGLMQTMTCEDEIGWRKGARRIILLCTDSTYHSAGDGKIVGAIKPHDMQCHLEDNLYTMALTYDYPSVSQINKIAAEKNFKIIFIISRNKQTGYLPEEEYQALTGQILGAKYAKLEDQSDVLRIIKEAYEESARYIKLQAVNPPPSVQLDFDQDCNSKVTRNCESTHTQSIVTIPTTLKIKSCPSSEPLNYEVQLGPIGLDEKLTIELEMDCICECERTRGEINSRCNNAGFLQCGVCKCNTGSYGVNCQCDGTSSDIKDMEKCKLNVNDTNYCSGKAECRCGKCETCEKGFSGDFCEFNDNSCPRLNNQLCSGNGNCTRGHCVCNAHWTGNDCSCSDLNDDCYAPYSNEVCSGNGICRCGMCVCKALQENSNETYSGVFCDDCEECAEKRCKELEDYAYCYYENMENRQVCDKKYNVTSSKLDVTFMNKTEINGPKLFIAKRCKKEFDNGTCIVFKYHYDNHKLKLTIQKELEDPSVANIWIAAASSIGLVLLIGIITVIIWKILVDLHDRREYNKFKSEASAAGYDISCNPLYQGPAHTFSNPMYEQ